MLEEVRIINSAVPTIEPQRLPIADGTKIIYGCALVKEDGKLRACKTHEAPEYISASGEVSREGDILVRPVLSNVIFLAAIKGETQGIGNRVSILCEDGIAAAVEADADGVGEITDLTDRDGYVFVKFKV